MNCKCIREIHVREKRRDTIRNGQSRDIVYIRTRHGRTKTNKQKNKK